MRCTSCRVPRGRVKLLWEPVTYVRAVARWCSLACRRPEQLTFLLLHDPCLLQHLSSVRPLSVAYLLFIPSLPFSFFLSLSHSPKTHISGYTTTLARNTGIIRVHIQRHASRIGSSARRTHVNYIGTKVSIRSAVFIDCANVGRHTYERWKVRFLNACKFLK